MRNERVKIALIIGLALIGYALINYKTKIDTVKERDKIETRAILMQDNLETEREEQRELDRKQCLLEAERDSHNWWMANCENHGLNVERNDDGEITRCSLSGYLSEKIKDTEQEEKDRCMEMFAD